MELTYALKVWFMSRFPHMQVVWPTGIMRIKFPKATHNLRLPSSDPSRPPSSTFPSPSSALPPPLAHSASPQSTHRDTAQELSEATSGPGLISSQLQGRVALLERAFKKANPY
jgi:hypothetical protein